MKSFLVVFSPEGMPLYSYQSPNHGIKDSINAYQNVKAYKAKQSGLFVFLLMRWTTLILHWKNGEKEFKTSHKIHCFEQEQ